MRSLRVLSVEDCEDDWLLLLHALEGAGYDVTWTRVQTAAAMSSEMARDWDLIICDFQLPGFNAMGALGIASASGRDVPFIIASGNVGEEAAVSALKAGAHDFVLKGQLARFIPTVTRALGDASERRERRRVEAELAESAMRYRRIVETAQEGIWMLDAEGCTTYVNRHLAELLKAPPEQLLGTRLSTFVADPDIILGKPPLGSALRKHVEAEFLCSDGSRFWASVSAAPIVDDDNRRLGSLATVVDVTEQRRLTEQLIVSDRMASVGTLAAGVAHEINNPLAVILANVELATRRLADERARGLVATEVAPLDEELREVREAARRVRDIVRDLRAFSSGDDLQTGPVDLSEVIDSAVRLARNDLRHKATLVKRLPPLPEVEANEGRLAQVFVNLLVNAAQAITEGQAETNQITVSGEVDPDWVTVEIGDTGSGMTPDTLRRLFTPFFTTKPVGVGMGLGLAISHRIVTSMGGEMSASSTAGAGTHFRVKLPVSRSPPLVRAAEEPLVAPVESEQGGRVLVVDDEPSIGIAMRRVLGSTHHVVHCPSARAALARLTEGDRYDVILCDLMMPEMTGAQFHAALVAVDPEQAARMFFLTGGAFTAEMQAFLAAAHNPVIEKPFDLDRVRTLVGDAVQRSRHGSPSETT